LIAAAIVASFLVVFVYDVLFEVFAGGRTPGKRRTGLRVVRESGAPVDLRSSSIRNIVRLVDEAVTLYLAGMISIVVTKRNQRLGDLAAGTLVVREPVKPEAAPQPMALPAAGPETAAWDVSAISPEELAAVRQFLERRWQIEANARSRLAWQLSEGLRGKVAGVPEQLRGEPFLEQVAAVKSARG
jgi:hypothetical protein